MNDEKNDKNITICYMRLLWKCQVIVWLQKYWIDKIFNWEILHAFWAALTWCDVSNMRERERGRMRASYQQYVCRNVKTSKISARNEFGHQCEGEKKKWSFFVLNLLFYKCEIKTNVVRIMHWYRRANTHNRRPYHQAYNCFDLSFCEPKKQKKWQEKQQQQQQ